MPNLSLIFYLISRAICTRTIFASISPQVFSSPPFIFKVPSSLIQDHFWTLPFPFWHFSELPDFLQCSELFPFPTPLFSCGVIPLSPQMQPTSSLFQQLYPSTPDFQQWWSSWPPNTTKWVVCTRPSTLYASLMRQYSSTFELKYKDNNLNEIFARIYHQSKGIGLVMALIF